jgi:hypothetical protein
LEVALCSHTVALAPVAVSAQQLEVLNARGPAERDRQDVVVLEVEARTALDAASCITLEDGST